MNIDIIHTLADELYSDAGYETRTERLFALLVDVGAAYVTALHADDSPHLDDPRSFVPATLGGVAHLDAAMNGLRENLEMREDL